MQDRTSIFPTFKMLIGIPGCGKSRWLNENKFGDEEIVCPDKIRKIVSGDVSEQADNNVIWEIAKYLTIKNLLLGKGVILDATNVNTFFRQKFIENLPKCNMVAVCFDVDPAIAYERILEAIVNGEDRSRVPEHAVYRMYGEYLYTKKCLEGEGFEIFIVE